MALCISISQGLVQTVAVPVEQCSSYVLLSPSDYVNLQGVSLSPSDLDALVPAIVLVLVVAFGFKIVRRVLFR